MVPEMGARDPIPQSDRGPGNEGKRKREEEGAQELKKHGERLIGLRPRATTGCLAIDVAERRNGRKYSDRGPNRRPLVGSIKLGKRQ